MRLREREGKIEMRKERSCEKKTYQKIIKRKMEETEDVKKGGQVREKT